MVLECLIQAHVAFGSVSIQIGSDDLREASAKYNKIQM